MCTYINEKAKVFGSAKGAAGYFSVTEANVGYDHPQHVALDHAILIDFMNPDQGLGARVAVELSAESARNLIRAIEAVLSSGEVLQLEGISAVVR